MSSKLKGDTRLTYSRRLETEVYTHMQPGQTHFQLGFIPPRIAVSLMRFVVRGDRRKVSSNLAVSRLRYSAG
jgi:hypothetical protein